MLRPFAGKTLIDICLDKLASIADYPVYFGAHEEVLLEKGRQRPNLNVVRRSLTSAESHSEARLVFEMLECIPQPYVCWVNPCHPFLAMATVQAAMRRFVAADCRAMTSVVLRKGWFYDGQFQALTNRAVQADTSLSDGLFEVAHAFHIYERERMLSDGRPWDNGPSDPTLHEIPEGEAWDIDTEEQFLMVEALFEATQRGLVPFPLTY
jgi:CMP-N-acetylneuraminic acid synthetase